MMGGFHYARIWHFAVMWAILFFVLGHLVMVILHGWNNFHVHAHRLEERSGVLTEGLMVLGDRC
jgi:hypothetical protein